MTRHVLRLMWNRKRQHLLLTLEIFVAFLVVVALCVIGLHFAHNARQPLGFRIERVWSIVVGRPGSGPGGQPEAGARDRLRQIFGELAAVPGVEAVAGAFSGPYRWYSWDGVIRVQGRPEKVVSHNRGDDRLADVLGLEILAGRWFSREDDGAAWDPVVISQRLAEWAFGAESPIGRVIPEVPGPSRPGPAVPASAARPRRVVGVIRDFRQFGELSTPAPVLFFRSTLDMPADRSPLSENIVIRVAPGTTAALEETIVTRLTAVAPDWSFDVQPVEALREDMLRQSLIPLVIVSVVAGALLLMVALGLTGVVWQNVTQRTREFGLRRAHGATARAIGRQVTAELLVTTAFAIVLGLAIVVQIPLLPLPPDVAVVPRPVFLAGTLLAVLAVMTVTLLCAWYPSRLATRVPPAEALHHE